MLELMKRSGTTANVVEFRIEVPKKLEASFEKLVRNILEISTQGLLFNADGEELVDASQADPGVVLEGARLRDGMTQAELAERLGVKQSNISEMENGKRTISRNMAKKLAEIFRTNYKVFL